MFRIHFPYSPILRFCQSLFPSRIVCIVMFTNYCVLLPMPPQDSIRPAHSGPGVYSPLISFFYTFYQFRVFNSRINNIKYSSQSEHITCLPALIFEFYILYLTIEAQLVVVLKRNYYKSYMNRICNASIPGIISSCLTSYTVSHFRFLLLFQQQSPYISKYIIRAMKYRNHVLNNKCRPRDYLLLSSRIGKKKVKKEINKIKIKIQKKDKIQKPKSKIQNQKSKIKQHKKRSIIKKKEKSKWSDRIYTLSISFLHLIVILL